MTPGSAITIKSRFDRSSLAFYRTHCVKQAWSRGVETWCGIVLPRVAIASPKGEQPCADCLRAIRSAEVA